MVPLTMLAFVVGSFVGGTYDLGSPDLFDITSICVVAIGVWLYNWFPEKP